MGRALGALVDADSGDPHDGPAHIGAHDRGAAAFGSGQLGLVQQVCELLGLAVHAERADDVAGVRRVHPEAAARRRVDAAGLGVEQHGALPPFERAVLGDEGRVRTVGDLDEPCRERPALPEIERPGHLEPGCHAAAVG